MNFPLTNEKGETIAADYFTMQEEVTTGEAGKVEFSQYKPVPLGDVPIFFSDTRGTSSQFMVMYRLKPYAKIRGGDYSTVISYSLGER